MDRIFKNNLYWDIFWLIFGIIGGLNYFLEGSYWTCSIFFILVILYSVKIVKQLLNKTDS